MDESFVLPSKASLAVWDVLLGRRRLDGSEHAQCFEVVWRDDRVHVGPVKGGPVVAPEAKPSQIPNRKASFLQRQVTKNTTLAKVSPAGLEPTTSGLGNQRSIHLSYGDKALNLYNKTITFCLDFPSAFIVPYPNEICG